MFPFSVGAIFKQKFSVFSIKRFKFKIRGGIGIVIYFVSAIFIFDRGVNTLK
jgi:hypothetical protein